MDKELLLLKLMTHINDLIVALEKANEALECATKAVETVHSLYKPKDVKKKVEYQRPVLYIL